MRSQPHMTCTRTRSSPLAARAEPRACMYSPQDPPRVIQLYLSSRGEGVYCARQTRRTRPALSSEEKTECGN